MDQLTKTLDFIKENIKTNLSLLSFIEGNPIYSAERAGNSVLVRGVSDYAWTYIESKDEVELKVLLKKLTPEDNYFAAIPDWIVPYLINKRKTLWDIRTYQYYLPEKVVFSDPHSSQILPLLPSDAEYIHNYTLYKVALLPSYLKDRILKGYSASIRQGNQLIAWILTHDDGAIGCLHVLNEYRQKHYGLAVCSNLCEKLRNIGKKPFCYLGEANSQTEGFFTKVGFKKTIPVNWLCVK
jgi:hypothetical protein